MATKRKTTKTILQGDEGMWPLNLVPVGRVKEKYGVSLSPEWLVEVQRSSVRMNNGGSASFVSPEGLLVTNHHVAASVLYELSSESYDYFKHGFLAKTLGEEKKAPHLEVNVLWNITDVTDRVENALKSVKSASLRSKKRRAVIARIEEESKKETGMRSDVVTLYNGGKYHLYQYKKYTDVRLVFAPESAIASFGGDIDNYEYPRYSLDAAFFRVYEHGKPLKTPNHFTWSTTSPKMNETLFVSGHPGSTNRLTTYDRIRHMRDVSMPLLMNYVRRKEILLQQFSGRSPESARRADDDLHSIQNVRKRFEGQLASIQSPDFFAALKEREETVRKAVLKSPSLKKVTGGAWDDIKDATLYFHKLRDEYLMYEGARAFSSDFFGIARTIVRMLYEDKKPSTLRLEEFGDARRESLLESLYSPAPLYKDLEEWKLADSLRLFVETFGPEDSGVKSVLQGRTIEETAHALVLGTTLDRVAARKKLVKGGVKGLATSKDPFVKLALLTDARSRSVREKIETNVEEVIEVAYGKIAKALFELYGENMYPDATFTLRLAYGRVVPFVMRAVPEQKYTTIGGVFAHGALHNYEKYWKLPERWEKKRYVLEKDSSAFNFITTHDTHGGNSGSPVFNYKKEIVGLLFDGLTHTQGDTFMYMDHVPEHTISVHTQGIYSVLKTVYGATRLVKELKG
ncbi:MAG: S46 family peptidase [Patescibacteria group bacterium]